MNSLTLRKIAKGVAAICLFITIIMPREVFGLLFELLHIVWELFTELLHLVFEGLESALDVLIESLLETDGHTTQIIVFYILFAGIMFLLYQLGLAAWKRLRRLQTELIAALIWHKTRTLLYWQNLTLINRIKLIAMIIGVCYAMVFFSM